MKHTSFLLLFIISCYAYGQDLVFSGYQGPASFDQYQQITPNSLVLTIENAGEIDLNFAYFNSYLYLSNDAILSEDDNLLGEYFFLW